jgi:predicted RNA-binding Zn-ribbon protein involved in translation (DUF1610 family)
VKEMEKVELEELEDVAHNCPECGCEATQVSRNRKIDGKLVGVYYCLNPDCEFFGDPGILTKPTVHKCLICEKELRPMEDQYVFYEINASEYNGIQTYMFVAYCPQHFNILRVFEDIVKENYKDVENWDELDKIDPVMKHLNEKYKEMVKKRIDKSIEIAEEKPKMEKGNKS